MRSAIRGKKVNKFETGLSKILVSCKYEPYRINYTIHSEHTYLPDFVNEKKKIMFEGKGRFRDRKDANKYKHIRDCLDDGWELIFIFYDADKPMADAKKRKDGSVQTVSDWATQNNFRWYTARNIPKGLR